MQMNLPEGYTQCYSWQLSLQARHEFGLGMGGWIGMVDFIHFCVRDCQLPALKSLLGSIDKTESFPDSYWLHVAK